MLSSGISYTLPLIGVQMLSHGTSYPKMAKCLPLGPTTLPPISRYTQHSATRLHRSVHLYPWNDRIAAHYKRGKD